MPNARFYLAGFHIGLLCLALAAGCAPARHVARSDEAPSVLRADPGHVNWLERQSVLGLAPEMAAIVSGSPLGWRPTGRDAGGTAAALLRRADVWLHVSGRTLLTKDKANVLAEMERAGLPRLLAAQGIGGLFLAPAHAGGAFWNDRHISGQPGEDAVSLGFSEHMGTDADFGRLSAAATEAGVLLGGDVLPAAPGRGPDFLLAQANVRDYPGAWIMMDVPREHWTALPAGTGALTAGQRERLVGLGILPSSLARDSLPVSWGLPAGGWAAGAETPGTDGVLRRWLYRYDVDPDRPVLHWDDPSAAARRMLSASVIREVGILRSPLAGLHLAPLIGLQRPGTPVSEDSEDEDRLEPALSALNTLTREIARYGGYSLERDALPLDVSREMLAAGADFVFDPATFPFAEHALLTGNAAPLRRAFDEALAARLPQNRLLRPLSREEGIPSALLPEQDRIAFLERVRAVGWPVSAGADVVHASVPALAAMRLGLSPRDAAGRAEAGRESVGALHELLLAFRAGLPGMIWLTGQDLYGVAHESNGMGATGESGESGGGELPAWSPDPDLRRSAAAGISLYDPGSLAGLPAITALRRELDVAGGRCLARPATRHPGSVAVVSRLPGGGTLLVAANFGDQDVDETLDLPTDETLEHLLGRAGLTQDGRRATLTLPAFSCAWFRGRP